MKLESIALHHGYTSEATTKAATTPIYQTTSFTFDNTQHGADLFDLKVEGNIYSRIMNPTNAVLEQRIAEMEGGEEDEALRRGVAVERGAARERAQLVERGERGHARRRVGEADGHARHGQCRAPQVGARDLVAVHRRGQQEVDDQADRAEGCEERLRCELEGCHVNEATCGREEDAQSPERRRAGHRS